MLTIVLIAALSQNELPPLAQRPVHVRVHLETAAPGAALYDVTALTRICRAPCGNWVDTYSPHTYQVRADGVTSGELDFDGLEGDVNVRFTPRKDTMFKVGRALVIAGAGLIAVGYVLAVAWLVFMIVGNIFALLIEALFWIGPQLFVGGFEVLYAAAAFAGAGVVVGGPGLPLMLAGRERLDVTAVNVPPGY